MKKILFKYDEQLLSHQFSLKVSIYEHYGRVHRCKHNINSIQRFFKTFFFEKILHFFNQK
jgi:hypothetical protein